MVKIIIAPANSRNAAITGRAIFVASSQDITRLLKEWGSGDRSALSELMPIVYEELRRIASRQLVRGSPDEVMQTTVLVHEVFLRLVDQDNVDFQNRAHFFAIAAKAMRQILINYVKAQHAQKRGAGAYRVSLSNAALLTDRQNIDALALDDALKTLAEIDERKSQIIELRFFGGLSLEETAEAIGVSPATVKREWQLARAWLLRELKKGE